MSTQNLPLFAAGCVTFVNAGIGIVICQVRTLFHKQVQSILPILEHAAKAQRPLLIIAEDVENEARSLIAVYGMMDDVGVSICPWYSSLAKRGDLPKLVLDEGGDVSGFFSGLKVWHPTVAGLGDHDRQ